MRRFNANKAARAMAAKKRLEAEAAKQKPLAWYWRAVNWLYRHLGPGRQRFLLRLKLALSRWWVNPAARPDQIGKHGRFEYRPAQIALSFELYADGSVLQLDRFGRRHEWVDDQHLIGTVHREYARLVEHGYKVGQLQRAVASARRVSQASNEGP